MEDFPYVLQKQEKQKVCFGSGCPRDTSRKGMSPFMKFYTLEEHPDVAPNSYNVLESFKTIKTKPCSNSISKKGYSGIARFGIKSIYDEDNPSPAHYRIPTFPKQVNKSKYPFGSSTKRKAFVGDKIPGPGMYVSTIKGGITFEHSFGGRVKMRLGVDLKCCSESVDICKICGVELIRDYWHLNNKVFLCRTCMNEELKGSSTSKKIELQLFRKVRNCSIVHQHGGTDAKVWLMHPADVAKWTRREAYLSAYLKG